MVEYGIRHFPGRCCPDYDCLYGSWDKKHCRECGADCTECTLYEGEIRRRLEVQNNLLTQFYSKIKQELIKKGYSNEIEWINNLPSMEKLNKTIFFREYVWVVINSGMKNQVAEGIFKNFWNDGKNFNFDVIRHPNKNKAIRKVYNRLDFYFDHFLKSKNKLQFLKSLPHIGDITKYHLARNLGLNVAKPDRHLVRITKLFEYDNVQKFCEKISDLVNDKIGVVDLVFWRFANLNSNYIEIIKESINLKERD